MKNQNMLIPVIVAVVVGVAAFFGGIKYQQAQQTKNFAQMRSQFGNGQRGGLNGTTRGGRGVSGEIVSSDDKSLTVKLNDGGSKIVILSSTTNINKAVSGTKDDLKTGERIMVFGVDNSDGSITAQNIQINQALALTPTK